MLARTELSVSSCEATIDKWEAYGAKNFLFTEKSLFLPDCHDRVYLPSQDGGVDANEYLYR